MLIDLFVLFSLLPVANKDWLADDTEHAKCETKQRVSRQCQSAQVFTRHQWVDQNSPVCSANSKYST